MKTKLFLGLLAASLVAPNISRAAWNHFDPADETKVPKLFSQTGFFSNWQTKTITPEAAYYDVNSPLWSDGAHKYRWVILPTGTKIKFEPMNDYWDHPNGAVYVKIFKHEQVPGDTTTTVWWETRVLVNKEEEGVDKWYGFSYNWDLAGKEAYLVSNEGIDTSLVWWPKGKAMPAAKRKWHYPTRDQCLQCHRTESLELHGRSVLGFFTAQINRPSKNNPAVNQITEFFQKGLFTWERGSVAPSDAELADKTKFPRWYYITDGNASLEERSRAYIASNCSGCHGTRGNAVGAVFGVDLNYDFFTMRPAMEYADKELTWDFGIDGSALVRKGAPEKSIILFRQKNRNTKHADSLGAFDANRFQMPPLATFEEDTTATKVMAEWIRTGYIGIAGVRDHAAKAALVVPMLKGRTLFVPSSLVGKVTMIGMDGRSLSLVRNGNGTYQIPADARRGLYMIRVGAKSFSRQLL